MDGFLFKRFLDMGVSFLIDNLPEYKEKLCDYSDAYAESTENEYDDQAARILRAVLGCPKGE